MLCRVVVCVQSFLRSGIVALVAAASLVSGTTLHGDAERARLIAEVNSNPAASWTAGHNSRWAGQPIHSIKRQLGVLDVDPPAHERLPLHVHTGFDIAAIPEEFDARTAWVSLPPRAPRSLHIGQFFKWLICVF